MRRKSSTECCARLDPAEAYLCPAGGLMESLSARWGVPLVTTLGSFGRLRFHELQAKLASISPSTLTIRLRELEKAGIVRRRTFAEVPPRVEYELTPSGRQLRDSLVPLVEWVRSSEAQR